MINFNIFLFLFCCVLNTNGLDLSKTWTVSCNSQFCKEGLDFSIASNCLGARVCTSIIELYYRSCTLCANDILDTRDHVLINGNYYPICDSSDDLHVKACLFYCRANWISSGTCVKHNNIIPICKCGIESTLTVNEITNTTTSSTTTSTTTTTTTTPFGTLLQTLNGHTQTLHALTVLQNGDLVSGSWDSTIKIWNPIDGTLKRTLNGHTRIVHSLAQLQTGDLASSSDDSTIKIWNLIDGTLKKTLNGHTSSVRALTVLQNGDLASGSDDKTIKIWSPKSK
jgi:WD40 repeat protein